MSNFSFGALGPGQLQQIMGQGQAAAQPAAGQQGELKRFYVQPIIPPGQTQPYAWAILDALTGKQVGLRPHQGTAEQTAAGWNYNGGPK